MHRRSVISFHFVVKALIFSATIVLSSGHKDYQEETVASSALYEQVKSDVQSSNTPPASSVSYALSRQGQGIGVGVALLGRGGEGWLQPLHAANNRHPLLLWTPNSPSKVPQWLDGQAAYVIAADSFRRIQQFLEEDADSALILKGVLHADVNITQQDFQIGSSVPVVMTVERRDGRYWKRKRKAEIRQLFRGLWRRHQSFSGLLIAQRSDGQWRGFVMDPLKKAREQIVLEQQVDDAVAVVKTQAELRTRDLGGHGIIFFFDYFDILMIPHRTGIGYTTVYTSNMKMILSLQNEMNFVIKYHDLFFEVDSIQEEFLYRITTELVHGAMDLCVMPYSLGVESLYYDILQATTRNIEIIVLFPTPDFLPAWSLPVRVFGRDLWLSLVACLLAYALAWRVVTNESLAASAAAALRAFSSCGGTPQDRASSTAQRLMLSGALLASAVVIVAAYQGRLYTLQVNPERYEEFITLEEIVMNGLPLISSHTTFPYKLVNDYLNKSGMVIDNDDLCEHFKCTLEADVSILRRRKAGEIFSWILTSKDWEFFNGILHIDGWSTLPKRYPQLNKFMHARRNWPWTDIFNRKTFQMIESGLMQHWDLEHKAAVEISYNARKHGKRFLFDSKADTENMPFTFGLKDVWSLFNILEVGLLLGTIVFVMEIKRGKKYSKNI